MGASTIFLDPRQFFIAIDLEIGAIITFLFLCNSLKQILSKKVGW
jgi:hypothetical protein